MSRADRLFRLTHLLARRRPWRVVDLARELEVTRRTIYRDIDELFACHVPVCQDARGYRLLDDAETPPLRLSVAERAVLILALGNPVIARQASLAPALKSLRGKLQAAAATMAESPDALRLASIDRSGPISDDVTEILKTGSCEGRQVRMLYQSLSAAQRRWRDLDPYELFHRGDAWYVVGRCHVNDEPRTFRLDRIIRAKLTDGRFQRPLDFRLERYLEDSWTVYTSSERWDVVIHFDAALAPLVDRARHHRGERKRRLPDGGIEYRARVSHLDEVARWVVGFEGKARAVEPEELRERVGELAAAVVVAHREPPRRVGRKDRRTADTVEGMGGVA